MQAVILQNFLVRVHFASSGIFLQFCKDSFLSHLFSQHFCNIDVKNSTNVDHTYGSQNFITSLMMLWKKDVPTYLVTLTTYLTFFTTQFSQSKQLCGLPNFEEF